RVTCFECLSVLRDEQERFDGGVDPRGKRVRVPLGVAGGAGDTGVRRGEHDDRVSPAGGGLHRDRDRRAGSRAGTAAVSSAGRRWGAGTARWGTGTRPGTGTREGLTVLAAKESACANRPRSPRM